MACLFAKSWLARFSERCHDCANFLLSVRSLPDARHLLTFSRLSPFRAKRFRQATDRLNNQWYINQSRTLSPTEREILRFMSRGYSMTQIAEQLKRNIKTIRAHKFNVMSKLGVSSDAGLLEAADILLCMRHCETSNVLHPY